MNSFFNIITNLLQSGWADNGVGFSYTEKDIPGRKEGLVKNLE